MSLDRFFLRGVQIIPFLQSLRDESVFTDFFRKYEINSKIDELFPMFYPPPAVRDVLSYAVGYSAVYGIESVVKILVTEGADLKNAFNDWAGEYSWRYDSTIKCGHILLEAGADPNSYRSDYRYRSTCLFNFVEPKVVWKTQEKIRLLAEAGAYDVKMAKELLEYSKQYRIIYCIGLTFCFTFIIENMV